MLEKSVMLVAGIHFELPPPNTYKSGVNAIIIPVVAQQPGADTAAAVML